MAEDAGATHNARGEELDADGVRSGEMLVRSDWTTLRTGMGDEWRHRRYRRQTAGGDA